MIGQKVVRQSRLGIACLVFVSAGVSPVAYGQNQSQKQSTNFSEVSADSSLLQVKKSSLVQPNLVDDLFPPDVVNTPTTPAPAKNAEPSKNTGKNDSWCSLGNCNFTGQGGSNNGYLGSSSSTSTPYNPYRTNQGDLRGMSKGVTDGEFQCNLFEKTELSAMLSSLNALNSAVNKPSCQGNVNLPGVIADNKTIKDAVTKLRGWLENPETVNPENIAEIGTSVDAAVTAATNLASTFANTAAFSKECRQSMSAGQIATSLNSVINGLTPYALMASSMTAGTAAVPFIVGGAVLTGAISSMAKIIDQNTVNIGDPLVRRAIVENTCQYIRLEQKYKFLVKNRSEQIRRISQEITTSESMFSAKISGVSPEANALLTRRNAIDKTSRELNDQLTAVEGKFDSEKVFFNANANPIEACNFGVVVARTTDDKESTASIMLASLDQAMAVYGSNSGVQAATVKSNAVMAIQQLKNYGAQPARSEQETVACSKMSEVLMKSIQNSAAVSKQLLKHAKSDIERQLQKTREFGTVQANLSALDQKKIQADRVVSSLDALRQDAISQSEINTEIDKIRVGLFSKSKGLFKGPVMKWFEYTENLHQNDVARFSEGLVKLREKAYTLTNSYKSQGKNLGFPPAKQLAQDKEDAKLLKNFTLQNVPPDTQIHTDVCREMNDVWDRWVKSVDHLAAMHSFCRLIEPYVYDNRDEDKDLVAMCRSDKRQATNIQSPGPSRLMSMKNRLVTEHKRDWALYLDRKMTELLCNQGPQAKMGRKAKVQKP